MHEGATEGLDVNHHIGDSAKHVRDIMSQCRECMDCAASAVSRLTAHEVAEELIKVAWQHAWRQHADPMRSRLLSGRPGLGAWTGILADTHDKSPGQMRQISGSDLKNEAGAIHDGGEVSCHRNEELLEAVKAMVWESQRSQHQHK